MNDFFIPINNFFLNSLNKTDFFISKLDSNQLKKRLFLKNYKQKITESELDFP